MSFSLSFNRFRIPVVAVVCAAFFLVYGLRSTGQQDITCNRLAPGQVQCQVVRSLFFGWLPTTTTQFLLQDLTIDSTICDNTPRGGVRFCHHVTLLGEDLSPHAQGRPASQLLPEMRTPLSAITVKDKFRNFIQGDGTDKLTFEVTAQPSSYLRTGVLGLLLGIVAWGFWDIQWPPVRVSALAMDGAEGE
jgi:hypothetical protein